MCQERRVFNILFCFSSELLSYTVCRRESKEWGTVWNMAGSVGRKRGGGTVMDGKRERGRGKGRAV